MLCINLISCDVIKDHVRMVALFSVVRLEWYIVDYACAILGIPTVSSMLLVTK